MHQRSSADWWTLVMAIGLYCTLPMIGNWCCIVKMLESPNAPGWVQAIGSIATLAVAFAVMSAQAKHARALEAEKRQADRRDRAEGVTALLGRLRLFLRLAKSSADLLSAQKVPALLDDLPMNRGDFNNDYLLALDAVKIVPAHEYGTSAFFIHLARQEAIEAAQQIDEFLKECEFWDSIEKNLTSEDIAKLVTSLHYIAAHGETLDGHIKQVEAHAQGGLPHLG